MRRPPTGASVFILLGALAGCAPAQHVEVLIGRVEADAGPWSEAPGGPVEQIELMVFELSTGVGCADLTPERTATGATIPGATRRELQYIPVDGGVGCPVGDVGRGRLGFVALARRQADCVVVRHGCAEYDTAAPVGQVIVLFETAPPDAGPAVACGARVCSSGTCGDPSTCDTP